MIYREKRFDIKIDIWTKAITDNGLYGGGYIGLWSLAYN